MLLSYVEVLHPVTKVLDNITILPFLTTYDARQLEIAHLRTWLTVCQMLPGFSHARLFPQSFARQPQYIVRRLKFYSNQTLASPDKSLEFPLQSNPFQGYVLRLGIQSLYR